MSLPENVKVPDPSALSPKSAEKWQSRSCEMNRGRILYSTVALVLAFILRVVLVPVSWSTFIVDFCGRFAEKGFE
jgi:hypothetical protein